MSNSETYDYLVKKYIQLGLLDKNGEKTIEEGVMDPNIYPDEGYIPECPTCAKQLKEYRVNATKEVEWYHRSTCIWYDFFIGKVKEVNPSVIIRRKGN